MKYKFYIKDTTINRNVYFDSVPQLVNYLGFLVKRYTGQDRKEYMQTLTDLGHGYDDDAGVTFTRTLAEKFEMGYVNSEAVHMQTDVHNLSTFNSKEYGDTVSNWK